MIGRVTNTELGYGLKTLVGFESGMPGSGAPERHWVQTQDQFIRPAPTEAGRLTLESRRRVCISIGCRAGVEMLAEPRAGPTRRCSVPAGLRADHFGYIPASLLRVVTAKYGECWIGLVEDGRAKLKAIRFTTGYGEAFREVIHRRYCMFVVWRKAYGAAAQHLWLKVVVSGGLSHNNNP